ncbi:MAG: KH domain-containing protein [Desulfobacterales bacterium]|nr:KH domain-containing protein [Desulfobacterales bacterium]
MESFEFNGKTAEEAIEKACRKLKLDEDGMDIEIVKAGSTGIFGLVGGRKAKIKVTIATEEVEPIESRTDTQGGNGLEIAKKALENILALIPADGTSVNGDQSNGVINLNIEGDKSGLLIGRKGRTLDALQFIVNKIVNKTLEKRTKVVIDSENYRNRRQDFLTQMALKMGEKAKQIKKPVSTNLLNPHDRRIIHMVLKEDERVETKSRGEGILKKVVILPKR